MRKGTDLLIGVRELKAYMRVGSGTLIRLVTKENFPVHRIRQGNGGRMVWVSSKGLVEEWLRGKIQEAQSLPSPNGHV